MQDLNPQNYTFEDYIKLKQAFEKREKTIESQQWVDRTLSEFDDLLRLNYNKSMEEFAEIVIQTLAKMSNAFSGVLYVFDQKMKVLQAKAGYACQVDTLAKKEYQLGEGLIGQAAISKEMMFFDNLPPEHTEVKLSSISVHAVNILIIPLVFNEKVYGVIELIHINALEEKYLTLLEKLNRNIAVMIESISNSALTKKLLSDSQAQATRLRTQEEELRQNLEELSATQEHLAIKEIEVKGQMQAINHTLATIEFDLNGYILSANDLFLNIMGYELLEIKGEHHKIFVEESYGRSEDYQRFWEKLRDGNSFSDEFYRRHKNGKEVWLRATYTPIFDQSDQPIKIMKLALDITDQKQQSLDYEGQLFAISKSNALVEFNLKGEILKANQLFLDLMEYELEEIKDQHHRLFVSQEDQESFAYQQFWQKLNEGQFQEGEFKRITKSGNAVWIRGSYNPILNVNGHPYKVVKVAQDISQQKMLEMNSQH